MFFQLLLILETALNRLFINRRKLSLFGLLFVAWSTQAFAENSIILVYGDSLSAAYGITQPQGWVTLLQQKLNAEGYHYEVANASISGETTSGGLTRFEKTITTIKPKIVVLALGANDGLRGLPTQEMRKNLSTMITYSQKKKAKVLLLGMRIPPNYGPKYTEAFYQTYQQLGQQHNINLVPFMLDQVAAKPHLIQADGLHPNALGQPVILNNIWPALKLMLQKNKVAKPILHQEK
ncbi:MAG TPA: arylesterase [Methylophilaceae bacterium]|nr:arylesterase [Methylophilaceae bacterium]HQC28542.1 arylesterase [Methylotenera sp.]